MPLRNFIEVCFPKTRGSLRMKFNQRQNFNYSLQIEELYAALLYMTQHQIGYDVCNECGQEVLLNHLQNAFKIDNETHERVLEETRNMEVRIHQPTIGKLLIFQLKICVHDYHAATGNASERGSDRGEGISIKGC